MPFQTATNEQRSLGIATGGVLRQCFGQLNRLRSFRNLHIFWTMMPNASLQAHGPRSGVVLQGPRLAKPQGAPKSSKQHILIRFYSVSVLFLRLFVGVRRHRKDTHPFCVVRIPLSAQIHADPSSDSGVLPGDQRRRRRGLLPARELLGLSGRCRFWVK